MREGLLIRIVKILTYTRFTRARSPELVRNRLRGSYGSALADPNCWPSSLTAVNYAISLVGREQSSHEKTDPSVACSAVARRNPAYLCDGVAALATKARAGFASRASILGPPTFVLMSTAEYGRSNLGMPGSKYVTEILASCQA
jgi:hypothetical protein